MEQETNNKPRKPFVAGLLSLVIPGLGQVYNGQWQKGVLFAVLEVIIGILVVFGLARFPTMLLGVVALLAFVIFILADAVLTARKQLDYALRPCNSGKVYALFIVVSLALGTGVDMVGMSSLYKSYKAPSGSMLQTLQVGDHFMTEILGDADVIERGDIVVFEFPDDPSKDYVKRAIGLPGETVSIENKVVSINGKPLDEPYANHTKTANMPVRDNFGPVTLGPGAYFMLGDNREGSYDSRWIGPIKRTTIKARALYIYFPGEQEGMGWFGRFGEEVR